MHKEKHANADGYVRRQEEGRELVCYECYVRDDENSLACNIKSEKKTVETVKMWGTLKMNEAVDQHNLRMTKASR